MVKTTENPTVLEGLKHEEFKEFFLAYVFGDCQSGKHQTKLLDIGEKMMEKLKGSPLAAKTVGRLLRGHVNFHVWEKVLKSKEWETQNEDYDIMPALKLSYDYLPFQLQQCFSYCGLFPEDYKFDSSELISFWIALGILHACPGKTVEDIGMSSLNGLVAHGFLKKEETNGHVHYIMHDLLHDLAVMVSSHECLSVHESAKLVGTKPCIRHLSIITNGVDCEHFKNELRKLKDILKVEDLQTLMFFGRISNSLANIFVDLFSEAKSFRVLRLPKVPDSTESVVLVPKFSELLHLRYLCLGTHYDIRLDMPDCISRFYYLRFLDLCYISWDVTAYLGNMPDLRDSRFQYMAGIVEFGLEQTFSKLTRLELVCLERLEKWVADGSHLFGHLEELIIKDCRALLELPFSDQQNSNKHRFPLLQKLEIVNCPEVVSLPPIPWTETLCSVLIKNSKLLYKLILSEFTLELETSGRGVVDSLDKILVFENLGELESMTLENLDNNFPHYCPPLQWKHLQLLKSLKKIIGKVSFGTTVVPTGCQGDVQWQLPIEDINMIYSGASGEEMTWLLQHLPKLSQLKIEEPITQLVFQQTITPVPEEVED